MDFSLLLADIRELVECESPSADLAAVSRSADVVARIGTARLGVAPERIVLDGRTHLRWRLGAGPSWVLVLGHHDTVWPMGSLATRPFSVEDGASADPRNLLLMNPAEPLQKTGCQTPVARPVNWTVEPSSMMVTVLEVELAPTRQRTPPGGRGAAWFSC